MTDPAPPCVMTSEHREDLCRATNQRMTAWMVVHHVRRRDRRARCHEHVDVEVAQAGEHDLNESDVREDRAEGDVDQRSVDAETGDLVVDCTRRGDVGGPKILRGGDGGNLAPVQRDGPLVEVEVTVEPTVVRWFVVRPPSTPACNTIGRHVQPFVADEQTDSDGRVGYGCARCCEWRNEVGRVGDHEIRVLLGDDVSSVGQRHVDADLGEQLLEGEPLLVKRSRKRRVGASIDRFRDLVRRTAARPDGQRNRHSRARAPGRRSSCIRRRVPPIGGPWRVATSARGGRAPARS